MGERLHRYCRTIFLVWLTAFILLVFVCIRSAGWYIPAQTPQPEPETLPIAVKPAPQPAPEPQPAPAPGPEPLAVGSLAGEGTLGKPECSGDKLVQEIRIPYTGTLGEYRTFSPHNVASRSFDIQGTWQFADIRRQYLDQPGYPIKLYQMALHNGFVRLSLVFHGNYRHKAEAFKTKEHIIIRLTAIKDANEPKATAPERQKPAAKSQKAPAQKPAQTDAKTGDTAPATQKPAQGDSGANGIAPAAQKPAQTESGTKVTPPAVQKPVRGTTNQAIKVESMGGRGQ